MSNQQKKEELVRKYYNNWVDRNRTVVRECLTEDFVFRSPQGIFNNPDDFLNVAWHQGEAMSIQRVEFVNLIASDKEAFVLIKWISSNGNHFHTAEVIKVNNDKIQEILIINHEPNFFDTL